MIFHHLAAFSAIRAAYPVVTLLPLCLACLSANSPAAQRAFPVCTDFHCDMTVQVTYTQAQWQQVAALFQLQTTPGQEREHLRQAIALMEQLAGGITGTWRDKGGNYNPGGMQGQLDCIAESRNTTTYLRLIEAAGLLRWHSVEERVMRRRWLVSEHWTAVIREHPGGRYYAVDSWYLDNGEPPCLQPLQDWRAGIKPEACGG